MKAPYGYTATGRIRKKPVKGIAPLAVPTPQPVLVDNLQKPEKFVRCPVTTCNKNFQHREDPHKAVWQHLLHHANSFVGDPAHKAAYAAIKEERKTETGEYDFMFYFFLIFTNYFFTMIGDKQTQQKRNSAR